MRNNLLQQKQKQADFMGLLSFQRNRLGLNRSDQLYLKNQQWIGVRDNRCKFGNTKYWKPMDNQSLQFTHSRPNF